MSVIVSQSSSMRSGIAQFHQNWPIPAGTPVTSSQATQFVAVPTLELHREGSQIPHYQSLIKQQIDASTDYERFSTSWKGEDAVWNWTYQYGSNTRAAKGQAIGNFALSALPSFTTPMSRGLNSSDYNEVLARLQRAAASREIRDAGLEFSAELVKDSEGLKRPFSALWDATNRYLNQVAGQSRKIRTWKRFYEMLRGTYLEYTFAAQPLVGGIDSILRTIDELAHEFEIATQHAGFTSRYEYSENYTRVPHALSLVAFKTKDRRMESGWGVDVRGYVGLSNKLLTQIAFSTRLGFDLKSFVPTAWNLLPFSFVADYFIGISDFLEREVASYEAVIYAGLNLRESGYYKAYADVDPTSLSSLPGITFPSLTQTRTSTATLWYDSFKRQSIVLTNVHPWPVLRKPGGRQLFNLAALHSAIGSVVKNYSRFS